MNKTNLQDILKRVWILFAVGIMVYSAVLIKEDYNSTKNSLRADVRDIVYKNLNNTYQEKYGYDYYHWYQKNIKEKCLTSFRENHFKGLSKNGGALNMIKVLQSEEDVCDPFKSIIYNPEIKFPEKEIDRDVFKLKFKEWSMMIFKNAMIFLSFLLFSFFSVVVLPVWIFFGWPNKSINFKR